MTRRKSMTLYDAYLLSDFCSNEGIDCSRLREDQVVEMLALAKQWADPERPCRPK